jgi:hypothetical protein
MTAKEIFKELGYKLNIQTETRIEYLKKYEVDGFGLENVAINFDLLAKGVYMYGFHDDANYYDIAVGFSFETFKAIQKQIEELGW